MTDGCSLGFMLQLPPNPDSESMPQKQSKAVDAVPAALKDNAALAAKRAVDETGEASFPASDPPSSWTWDVAGKPPGSATR
jgi:hypothetical protein